MLLMSAGFYIFRFKNVYKIIYTYPRCSMFIFILLFKSTLAMLNWRLWIIASPKKIVSNYCNSNYIYRRNKILIIIKHHRINEAGSKPFSIRMAPLWSPAYNNINSMFVDRNPDQDPSGPWCFVWTVPFGNLQLRHPIKEYCNIRQCDNNP